jgi:hypothetical protein
MHNRKDDKREHEDRHEYRPSGREESEKRADDHEHFREPRAHGRSKHSDEYKCAAASQRGQPEEEGQWLIEMRY